MKKIITPQLLLTLLVALFYPLAPSAGADAKRRLVVVVAKGSPLTNLSSADLKRLFFSESVLAGQKKLVPFNYNPGTPERLGFDRTVLGMTPEQMGRFWIDRKIRGQLPAPRAVPSVPFMLKLVEQFPNAVGYLPEGEVPSSVQAVKIDGHAHTDPVYAIHSD